MRGQKIGASGQDTLRQMNAGSGDQNTRRNKEDTQAEQNLDSQVTSVQ